MFGILIINDQPSVIEGLKLAWPLLSVKSKEDILNQIVSVANKEQTELSEQTNSIDNEQYDFVGK